VVNAENWSMRKGGQRGKVVNGKVVNGKKAQKCQVLTLNKKVFIQNILDYVD
jgi:hypothetical protein